VKRAVAGRLRGGPESELVFNAIKQEQRHEEQNKAKSKKKHKINSKHVVIPKG
jgi:hypothetical protein